MYTAFQKALVASLNDFLHSALVHLRELLPLFNQYYLNSSTPRHVQSEEEPIELNAVACSVVDFVNTVVHGSKSKPWLQTADNLENLVLASIGWMQMTPSDVCHFDAVREDYMIECRKRIGDLMLMLSSLRMMK